MEYRHVDKKFHYLFDLSDDARIAFLDEPRWINYPCADEVIDTLRQLLEKPKRARMPSLFILGDSNNGKTTTALRFFDRHGEGYINERNEPVKPVIFAQSPPSADERGLYISILNQFFTPYSASASKPQLRYKVIDQLQSCHTRMLILDEIHNLLAGTHREQQLVMNAIKLISNELKIPIVGLGVKTAASLVQRDPQYASRFPILTLPLWELDKNFQRMLVGFEKILPLRQKSMLRNPEIAAMLHSISGGNTGNLHELLIECAKEAIKSKKEKIDLEILKGNACFRPTTGTQAQK